MLNLPFSPSIDYVRYPNGIIPNIKRAIGRIGRIGRGSYITALSDRDPTGEV